jgi:hypothetical protein
VKRASPPIIDLLTSSCGLTFARAKLIVEKNVVPTALLVFSIGCANPSTSSTYASPQYPTYVASYDISLIKVERPEEASKRFGSYKVETITSEDKYKYSFEDDMVKTLWIATSRHISFRVENKTDQSIKIPWDEAAYVDINGVSHRVLHSGVEFTDRDNPQPPSEIVRKGSIEDTVYPIDHFIWESGNWRVEPLFPDLDLHGGAFKGKFPSIGEVEKSMKRFIGAQVQVLLPLQIEETINDYVFTFRIDDVTVQAKDQNL